ncbi:hypothetical protein BDN71DRAFT_1478720 [Pleurotus eryngii]|uniref:Heterokaryon incompatibility domain-containing protein n=1 Tax=Pleurotus eryngii TaxID=5323 RepID=A0A9P5ZGK2_PLEER|nr:hypothetical protein BDN71DRAFT_1478720 [Pleurotus eryngii]
MDFFSTIPLESSEIRLLRLASKEQDAPGLRGELFVTPLFRPPDFTALSYTWGDPGVRSEILINGNAKLSITTSLEVALLALQREDAPVALWIDQICINQDDAREKAVQVPLMSQICSSASQTIAWLGPATDGSDLVIDFLDSIGSEGVEVGLQDLTNEDVKDILAHAAADPGWLHRSPSSLGPTSNMEALIHKLALQHGEYPIIHNRNWYHNPEKHKIQTLGYLIHKYRSRPQFADRRDRIYGLLGLACDADTLGIEVDYTKTWEEVYTDATKRIINRGKIDVLSMVEYPKTSSRLPSWVSDLNMTRRDSILRDVTITSIRPFAAAASTSHLPPLDSDEQPHILTCRGVIVDHMHEVGRQWALKEDGVSRSPLGALLPCSDVVSYIAIPIVSNHPHAASPARRAEATWRIPVIDHEYIDASVGTSRRATTVSRHAYDEDVAEVIPLTDKQSEELEHVGPQEREARATQMRIARLRLSATAQSYFGLMSAIWHRRPFVGKGGFVGVGPLEMESGDVVCVLYGAMVPFVLRPINDGEGNQYALIGECYCDGIMDGEALGMGLGEEVFRIT